MTRQSIEELAMQYVLEVQADERTNLYLWDLLQQMHARCGIENTNIHLANAREILRMVGAKEK